jgi:MFS superfamily sulfate permease-like transporter
MVKDRHNGVLPKFDLSFLRQDVAAGFVVFLVALPLCLGIALASDAPPLSGLITGVIAGLVVSIISGSELSVSGPAAGLAVTVIATQKSLGGLEGLLVATILAGVFQIVLGTVRAGLLATFFPSSVIKGMLAGIGVIIIFKQIPLAVGWRGDFLSEDGIFCVFSSFCLHSVYASIMEPHSGVSLAAVVVSVSCLALLVGWDHLAQKRGGVFRQLPGPLLAVILGVVLNAVCVVVAPEYALTLERSQLVSIPALRGFVDFFSHGPSNVSGWLANPVVWSSAAVIAIIASVETLLCLEATDKLDPFKRVSRPNRELVAQGIGNMLAGASGGIPMTSVIVRSSANIYAGARTRISGVIHGFLLLVSVLAFPGLLARIPLASLAAILIVVGYKLVNRKILKQVLASGYDQFFPFIITAGCVVMFDLLSGVLIGTVVGLLVVLIMNHHRAFTVVSSGSSFYLRFAKDVTFLQKIALKRALARIPNKASIVIDGSGAMFIDRDIAEVVEDFQASAVQRGIEVVLRNMPEKSFDLLHVLGKRGA